MPVIRNFHFFFSPVAWTDWVYPKSLKFKVQTLTPRMHHWGQRTSRWNIQLQSLFQWMVIIVPNSCSNCSKVVAAKPTFKCPATKATLYGKNLMNWIDNDPTNYQNTIISAYLIVAHIVMQWLTIWLNWPKYHKVASVNHFVKQMNKIWCHRIFHTREKSWQISSLQFDF